MTDSIPTPGAFIISGATGIGAETARLLAAQGRRIFIVAREEEACAELTRELRALGAQAESHACDLVNPASAPLVIQECNRRFGRLDGLFNVAGTSGRRFGDGAPHECTEEGWAATLDANLTTQYRMCREALRILLAQPPGENGQRGVILNMSSILALDPDGEHFSTVAYSAAKGAIISMSRTMAATYARQKIRVNVVAPALVRTAMSARASEDAAILDFMRVKQPLTEGLIPVQDVAAACAFLLTDASRSITGQVLCVDAGWGLA
jgi:NAD(P)-dependent dehydrogenase (short-subunit alcohol dehydrogenase family)